jgi:hypothetical protein
VDVNTTVGSNASGIGHAVAIQGASSSSYGKLQVASGVTLTLRGYDTTSNTLMLIGQYGIFNPLPGSTIVGDVTGDYSSMILNQGIISALGTSGSPITFTSPSGSYSWANSASAEAWNAYPSAGYIYDPINSIACVPFFYPWIANAAGTGLGSVGDSSVSFGGTNATSFTSEQSSIAACTSTGKYFIDYDLGVVYFWWNYASGQPNFTKTYKYLVLSKGWGISSINNYVGHAAIFDYCKFTYMGKYGRANLRVLAAQYKTDSSTADREFRVTHCTFQFCTKAIGIANCNGADASHPILITGNTFYTSSADGNNGEILVMSGGTSATHIKVDSNTVKGRTFITLLWDGLATDMTNLTDWVITNNTATVGVSFISGRTNATNLADGLVSGNAITGCGQAFDERTFNMTGGTSGHPLVISGNTIAYVKRACHYSSYLTLTGNSVWLSMHHGFTSSGEDDVQITGLRINNNLFFGESTNYNTSPMIELGYNHRHWIDDVVIANNTVVGAKGGVVGWGDVQDTACYTAITRASVVNNLGRMVTAGSSIGWDRLANVAGTRVYRVHANQWDYNLDYNFNTRYQNGLHHGQGTFSAGGSNYNTQASGTRNVPGVALFDPSFSSKSGGQLAFTYTSATSQTLAWGSGSAVQLVADNGTATGGSTGTNGLNSTLTDTGKSWSTTIGTGPALKWVKITGGTGAGQIRMITNNTATVLTVVPVWSVAPTNGSTYTIIEPEVQLVDGAETVQAGIYLPDLPTASGTDTGISFADNSKTGSDPLLTNASGTAPASYKVSSSSPAKDAGTSINAPAADYFGKSRPQGAGYDIGFYELPVAGASSAFVQLLISKGC